MIVAFCVYLHLGDEAKIWQNEGVNPDLVTTATLKIVIQTLRENGINAKEQLHCIGPLKLQNKRQCEDECKTNITKGNLDEKK